MSYIAYPSGTMLIPSGPSNHLFIVITKICTNGMHLLLSVSSIKEGVHYDSACEFVGGEHDFIRHPSYVYYRLAEQQRADKIAKMIGLNYYVAKSDLDAQHFDKVCDGVIASKFIKPWAVKYFNANRPR